MGCGIRVPGGASALALFAGIVGAACGSADSGASGPATGGLAPAASAGAANTAGVTMGGGAWSGGTSGSGAAGAGQAASGAPTGAASGSGGAAGTASGGSAGASVADLCPELPTARHASGSVLELGFQLTLEDKPLAFGEENAVASGGSLTPLGLRFYVSEVALVRASSETVAVDVVTANGGPAPYGVHLYNAEDAASETFRVRVPPGEYTAMTFLLGLAQPCNVRVAEQSKAPLSPTSAMTWPHTGYLFLRYEGRFAPEGAEAAPAFPPMIHMGGNLFEALAPRIRIDGALSVQPGGSVRRTLRVAMGEVFRGALAQVDLSGFVGPPGEEVLRGERLRRSFGELRVFSFGP